MMIRYAFFATTVLAGAGIGCNGAPAPRDVCTLAAEHVAACLQVAARMDVASCDQATAGQLLNQDCDALKQTVGQASKADDASGNPDGWLCRYISYAYCGPYSCPAPVKMTGSVTSASGRADGLDVVLVLEPYGRFDHNPEPERAYTTVGSDPFELGPLPCGYYQLRVYSRIILTSSWWGQVDSEVVKMTADMVAHVTVE